MVTGVATQSVGSRTKTGSVTDWAAVRARKPRKTSKIMVDDTSGNYISESEFIQYSAGSEVQKRSTSTLISFSLLATGVDLALLCQWASGSASVVIIIKSAREPSNDKRNLAKTLGPAYFGSTVSPKPPWEPARYTTSQSFLHRQHHHSRQCLATRLKCLRADLDGGPLPCVP